MRLSTVGCALLLAVLGVPAGSAATSSGPPGTVIGTAPLADPKWAKLKPEAAAAQHVTYWSTQRVAGRPRTVQVTGTLFRPAGTPPPGGWPVVAWAHGTVGIGDGCAPSATAHSDRDAAYLKHWLAQGYAVAATDYAGLGTPGVHPYLDGSTAAYNIVDMVRAAQDVEPSMADKWVVIGQSQGGHAALFTADLAAEYAPESDFRGGVATGPPSSLEHVVSLANPLLPDIRQPGLTAFLAYILTGLATARPDVDVDSYLSDSGREIAAAAQELCYADMVERVRGVSIGSLLRKPLTDPLFHSAISSVIKPPVRGYDRPCFIGQGTLDTVVWPPLTAKLAAELTLNGQPVTVKTYAADHSGTMAASLPDTTPYVAKLLK